LEFIGETMHTTALKSCRIHHHGDYDGYVFITNMDSTSDWIEPKATIKYTVRKLVNFQRRLEKIYFMEAWPGKGEVILKGLKEDGYDKKITILAKDIEDFLAIRLMDKIEEKLEDRNISYSGIVKIAQELGIKE